MTIKRHELIERFGLAVDRHAAALFVGAGLSMQAGLPGWDALVKPLAAEIGAEQVTDMPLVAEYYEQNAGGKRPALESHLLTKLSTIKTPSRGHELISQLHVSEIWTTNFDPLLELANPTAVVVNLDSETSAIGTGQPVIVKMHGGFKVTQAGPEWQSPPVITRGDFERYEQRRPRTWTMLQASYLTKTMLFLGFSFADPNIELLLRLARRQGTQAGNQHLAILRRPPTSTEPGEPGMVDEHVLRVRDLESNGVAVCEIADFADLVPVVEALQLRTRPSRLFVAGSGKHAEEHDWCDRVGEVLARQPGWQVASLAGDAGWWTTQRVSIQRKAYGTYQAEDLLLYFRKLTGASAPSMDDRVGTAVYSDKERHPLVDDVIADCRAMVVIGGGNRTLEEVQLARAAGVGVVPLAASGGAALDAWDNATKSDKMLGGRPAPDQIWAQLNDSDRSVAAQAVEHLLAQAMYATA